MIKLIFIIVTLISFTSIAQADTCIYSLSSTPASCDTCCDGSVFVNTVGDDCGGAIFLSWVPNDPTIPANQACAGVTYIVTITDANGITIIDSITIQSEPLSIEEQNTNFKTIRIFPNPANYEFNIVSFSSENIVDLRIYDLQGSEVLKETNVDSIINIGALSPGAYFLIVQLENGDIKTTKLIVY
jgi:hypothetical protein